MVYIPTETGQWVDERFARLAEVIQDYDQWLELRWIPPDKRTRDDKNPYVVVDTRTNIPVFYASALDTPEDILEKLFRGDTTKQDVLGKLEARERAQKALEYKEKMEQYEEMADVAEFFWKTPLHTFKHNGKVIRK